MSGNASCSWAIRDTVHVRNTIRAHAEVLGWVEPEGNALISCNLMHANNFS